MQKLEPGDIFAVKKTGILMWLSQRLFTPWTDRFHHGILWKRWDFGNDFIILESIAKGLAIGKLSWYEGKGVKYYRVDCPGDLRHAAPNGLIDWGRSHYDCLLISKIPGGMLVAWARILWKEHRIRKLRAEDLPYATNDALICTEGPDVAYDSVGVNVIPPGVIPIHTTFKQAELDGRMAELC